MKRFIEGEARSQITLLPECLDDYIAEDNPVRVVDVFVDELNLHQLGFEGAKPAATGRPSYHPAVLLKLYIYGYLNQVQSSRRLEREAQRNVELMWLTGRLTPDFKTIADFRKDHGDAIGSTNLSIGSRPPTVSVIWLGRVPKNNGKSSSVVVLPTAFSPVMDAPSRGSI